MAARTLMIQGTASHVGKSTLTAALCRQFRNRGIRVAPFKAQNMSNNSFVTPDGKEIGRAQAVQAAACRLAPRADFNPVLIKPAGERSAQLVVDGTVAETLSTADFGLIRRRYWTRAAEALGRLTKEFDLVLLEGAGSPAEINLRHHDIVNMAMAREAGAPVLLVGDIDRGGVFAALMGTLVLLEPEERRHIRGFVINKFRGDQALLAPGIDMLSNRTGLPCLGVLPYREELRVPEEDSLGWDSQAPGGPCRYDTLVIGILDIPYLSNFTDLDALAREPDVQLVRLAEDADRWFDAVVIPGTKQTACGLQFVKKRGLDRLIHRVWRRGGMIIGLCGGYQMLGRLIRDPHGVESTDAELDGLGLLDAVTTFEATKVVRQVSGIHPASGCPVEGYEIHMGRTVTACSAWLHVRTEDEPELRPEGAVSTDGRIVGTYVHGLFDAPQFRRHLLNGLRAARGWPALDPSPGASLDGELDRLADFVAHHLDIGAIESIIERGI